MTYNSVNYFYDIPTWSWLLYQNVNNRGTTENEKISSGMEIQQLDGQEQLSAVPSPCAGNRPSTWESQGQLCGQS